MPAQEQLLNELDILPLQKISIQCKLSIGATDDPLEHEADAMADTIMRMPEQNFIQRKCRHCEEEEKVQRKPLVSFIQRNESLAGTVTSDAVSNQINASKGSGRNMDSNTQSFMQTRFGTEFSEEKIHTSAEAIQMNRDLNVKAFTVGNDIYFNEGEYNPGSGEGKHLLAHELTHVVQQESILNSPKSNDSLNGISLKFVQRKGSKDPEITNEEVISAIFWAKSTKLGLEAINELQSALGELVTGIYDETTARAVFRKQREWQKHGVIAKAGRATSQVFWHLGLISTKTINSAIITNDVLEQIKTLFPNGITVAICPQFKKTIHGASEFLLQAGIFATNQKAVGLSSTGEVVLGIPVYIKELEDVIEAIQAIHLGILQKYLDSNKTDGETQPSTTTTDEPAFTKIKNLALFSHGESWGLGLNESNTFISGGLHSKDTADNPANIVAFVRGISSAITSDLRVELFACSTGHDPVRTDYEEWTKHTQGDSAGANSFAASLTNALGPDGTVSGHITAGHTTENFAARVFGAEADGKEGIHIFDLMYDESFIKNEVGRLFPDKTDSERALMHDSLREQMWAHFKDSVQTEHGRKDDQKRYSVPMGQEMFVNPDNARQLFHNDWTTNWIPNRLKNVKPPVAKSHK